MLPVPEIELKATDDRLQIGKAVNSTKRALTVSFTKVGSLSDTMHDIQNSGTIAITTAIKKISPRLKNDIRLMRGITSSTLLAPIVLPTSVFAVVERAFIGMKTIM